MVAGRHAPALPADKAMVSGKSSTSENYFNKKAGAAGFFILAGQHSGQTTNIFNAAVKEVCEYILGTRPVYGQFSEQLVR